MMEWCAVVHQCVGVYGRTCACTRAALLMHAHVEGCVQVYKDVCWKSSMLTENKDKVPSSCRVWNPTQHWDEDEWWQLVKLFQSQKTSSRIEREDTQVG